VDFWHKSLNPLLGEVKSQKSQRTFVCPHAVKSRDVPWNVRTEVKSQKLEANKLTSYFLFPISYFVYK
jgi:hypothetical protein